ncbi:hypothetical protein BT69DRAFT_1275674 [Atractiella rhizophila]|nr:hypothetical protein BT69DRAFT_1275674 [Atractiella rhizophila]
MDLPTDFRNTPHTESAYSFCRDVERSLKERVENARGSEAAVLKKMLINVRILGRLLEFCPTQTGKDSVATSIISASREFVNFDSPACHDMFSQLGEFYDQCFIRTFRKAKGPTPQVSEHPSRPSFDRKSELIEEWLVPHPRDHCRAKQSALIRDRFRCVLSGRVDQDAADLSSDILDEENSDALIGRTECAHIFSETTNANLEDEAKAKYASNAWMILETFGHPEIQKELEGQNVHRLSNVMTLDAPLHDWFDKLKLWLQPTGEPNVYKIEARNERLVFRNHRVPRQVRLTTQDAQLDLPNPKYLALHAACSRVAHLSGAADHLDRMDSDRDHPSLVCLSGELTDILAARLYDLQMSRVVAVAG